jgi:hypothetical protein
MSSTSSTGVLCGRWSVNTRYRLLRLRIKEKNVVSWVVTACGSYRNRCFRGKYRLHLQGELNERTEDTLAVANNCSTRQRTYMRKYYMTDGKQRFCKSASVVVLFRYRGCIMTGRCFPDPFLYGRLRSGKVWYAGANRRLQALRTKRTKLLCTLPFLLSCIGQFRHCIYSNAANRIYRCTSFTLLLELIYYIRRQLDSFPQSCLNGTSSWPVPVPQKNGTWTTASQLRKSYA